MFSLTRLAMAGYLFVLSLGVFLLLSANLSRAQSRVSGGFRGTPALPTIAIPIFRGSGSASGATFGGMTGFTGGNLSGSFSTQIMFVNLGAFFPNRGRIIGLPLPAFTPPLDNFFFDSTGSPLALLLLGSGGVGSLGLGGIGLGGGLGMGGGFGGPNTLGSFGQGGFNSLGGGMTGFAGKGLGGFNGRNAL